MKIGFIDHHLNNYHANTFLRLMKEDLAHMGAEVITAWESDPQGEDWCAANNIYRAESPQQVVDNSDAVMVLSPDNLECHVDLTKEAVASGKPVFIDKLLAPTPAEAEHILQSAQTSGSPVMSASALSFASELTELLSIKSPVEGHFTGMGVWPVYGIHTIALMLTSMCGSPEKLIDTGTEHSHYVTVQYDTGARAYLTVRNSSDAYGQFPWTAGLRVDAATYPSITVKDYAAFYRNMIASALRFFDTGETTITSEKSLDAVKVLEGASRSLAAGNQWVDV